MLEDWSTGVLRIEVAGWIGAFRLLNESAAFYGQFNLRVDNGFKVG